MDNNDNHSLSSSIEVCDAVINESWDWAKLHKNNGKGQDFVHINIGDPLPEHESVFGRIWRYWSERAINRRVAIFEKREMQAFKMQRLAKIKQIFADEEIKTILIKWMMCAKTQELLDDNYEVLKRKYGMIMADYLLHHSRTAKSSIKSHRRRLSVTSLSMLNSFPNSTNLMTHDIAALKQIDPLSNWLTQSSDVSSRMLARIQNMANLASTKVKWSFLIEPGRPQTDLSTFYAEFDILESFFDKIELSSEEMSQRAFDLNYATKARNRKIECADCSRVKLTVPEELTKDGITSVEIVAINRRPQPSDIFGDCDCPRINVNNECGYGDFIHANYIVGGPLLNKFILTQAPLRSTMSDFWRMIWQEKSEYIFMLCEACDTESLGLMSSTVPDCCPYYWPRYEGELKRFGKLIVQNEGLDTAIDPLFNVTYLAIYMEDEPGIRLKVQHWQWDWRNYTDFYWPFRLLIRSRHSKFPTVVQCIDGCGRSGSLVLIEIFLMQLLRGTTSFENTMLTSAVFLRLQRRHAIANHMQYLFAYRTVLHWAEPFILSKYNRFVLGFVSRNSGFAAKYDQIAHSYLRRTLL